LRVETDGAFIHAIPNLNDNYCYLVVDRNLTACLIDAGDAKRVLQAIPAISYAFYQGAPISVKAILTTHKHWDHQGGNVQICQKISSCTRVYCGEDATPYDKLHLVKDGEIISVGTLSFEVIQSNCHTRGSVMFLLGHDKEKQCLFTGDTLFSGGCGALFEGTNMQMQRNFYTIKRRCKPSTLLFPGHEYTELLLSQAFTDGSWGGVSPGHFFTFANALYRTYHRRHLDENLPTLPISLKEELVVNPNFYQVDHAMKMVKNALVADESPVKSRESKIETTYTTCHDHYTIPYVMIEEQDWNSLKKRCLLASENDLSVDSTRSTSVKLEFEQDGAASDHHHAVIVGDHHHVSADDGTNNPARAQEDEHEEDRGEGDSVMEKEITEEPKDAHHHGHDGERSRHQAHLRSFALDMHQAMIRMEQRPFATVEERASPFASKVETLEDALRICGTMSDTDVLSKDLLEWCLKDTPEAVEELNRKLFSSNDTLTPKEAAKILETVDATPGLCSRLATWCCTKKKALVDISDDEDEECFDQEVRMPLHTADAHDVDRCSYCRPLLQDFSAREDVFKLRLLSPRNGERVHRRGENDDGSNAQSQPLKNSSLPRAEIEDGATPRDLSIDVHDLSARSTPPSTSSQGR